MTVVFMGTGGGGRTTQALRFIPSLPIHRQDYKTFARDAHERALPSQEQVCTA